MKGLSRGMFDNKVSHYESDKYSKGFSTWNQLLVMIYSQLSGCKSLREVELGFNQQARHHYHLGCRPVKRSTLSDANAKKDPQVFNAVCQTLLKQVNRKVRQEIEAQLLLLDSSSITLKGQGFDHWTKKNSTRNTQGIKLHMMYSPEMQTPHYLNITSANVNDISDAKEMSINEGTTYVFDKGYCDYNWWHKLNISNAQFVTRFKRNASLEFIKDNEIPDGDREIVLKDSIVKLKNKHPRAKHINQYEQPLRQITIARPEHDTPLILATNDFKRSANAIAACYKSRWKIELFFKWIKQNLKIKQYLGRSENAVRIQIYTAIISYLLIALYRHTNKLKSSMKETFILICTSLFQRPDSEQYWIEKQRKQRLQQKLLLQAVLL
jgi:IS4 transposase